MFEYRVNSSVEIDCPIIITSRIDVYISIC